jgi:hypothetical protein
MDGRLLFHASVFTAVEKSGVEIFVKRLKPWRGNFTVRHGTFYMYGA